MVVGMVSRVEIMMVQGSVEPVVEVLDRAGVEKRRYNDAVSPPRWQGRGDWEKGAENVEEESI